MSTKPDSSLPSHMATHHTLMIVAFWFSVIILAWWVSPFLGDLHSEIYIARNLADFGVLIQAGLGIFLASFSMLVISLVHSTSKWRHKFAHACLAFFGGLVLFFIGIQTFSDFLTTKVALEVWWAFEGWLPILWTRTGWIIPFFACFGCLLVTSLLGDPFWRFRSISFPEIGQKTQTIPGNLKRFLCSLLLVVCVGLLLRFTRLQNHPILVTYASSFFVGLAVGVSLSVLFAVISRIPKKFLLFFGLPVLWGLFFSSLFYGVETLAATYLPIFSIVTSGLLCFLATLLSMITLLSLTNGLPVYFHKRNTQGVFESSQDVDPLADEDPVTNQPDENVSEHPAVESLECFSGKAFSKKQLLFLFLSFVSFAIVTDQAPRFFNPFILASTGDWGLSVQMADLSNLHQRKHYFVAKSPNYARSTSGLYPLFHIEPIPPNRNTGFRFFVTCNLNHDNLTSDDLRRLSNRHALSGFATIAYSLHGDKPNGRIIEDLANFPALRQLPTFNLADFSKEQQDKIINSKTIPIGGNFHHTFIPAIFPQKATGFIGELYHCQLDPKLEIDDILIRSMRYWSNCQATDLQWIKILCRSDQFHSVPIDSDNNNIPEIAFFVHSVNQNTSTHIYFTEASDHSKTPSPSQPLKASVSGLKRAPFWFHRKNLDLNTYLTKPMEFTKDIKCRFIEIENKEIIGLQANPAKIKSIPVSINKKNIRWLRLGSQRNEIVAKDLSEEFQTGFPILQSLDLCIMDPANLEKAQEPSTWKILTSPKLRTLIVSGHLFRPENIPPNNQIETLIIKKDNGGKIPLDALTPLKSLKRLIVVYPKLGPKPKISFVDKKQKVKKSLPFQVMEVRLDFIDPSQPLEYFVQKSVGKKSQSKTNPK